MAWSSWWLVVTSNVLTRKPKSSVIPRDRVGCLSLAEVLPSMCNKRLQGESLRILSILGNFHAQETKPGQNGDHERGFENLHSEEWP